MINEYDVCTKLVEKLDSDAVVSSLIFSSVKNSVEINEDLNATPWVGVYPGGVTYTPRTLGIGIDNYMAVVKTTIMVQAASLLSGDDCRLSIDSLIKSIVDVVLDGTNIGGFVTMVKSISIDHNYAVSERESIYFQNSSIDVESEVQR